MLLLAFLNPWLLDLAVILAIGVLLFGRKRSKPPDDEKVLSRLKI
jgi:hypothetical protein